MAKANGPSAAVIAAVEKLLGIDANSVRRVVIDIKAGAFPTVYTELFGDQENVLSVVEALSSVEIERK